MKTIVAFTLCLVLHQSASSEVALAQERSIPSLFALSSSCNADGSIGCTEDCKAQRYCMFGQEITIDCAQQTGRAYCDPQTFQCTSSIVSCPIVENFICPREGYYPYALDCTKLWHCTARPPAKVVECGNLIFDPLNKRCTSGITCYSFSYTGSGLCRGKEGLLVAHPLNKAIYAYCNGTFPQVNECPEGHFFNASSLSCEFQCSTIGKFKNPWNRQCYYSCTKSSNVFRLDKLCCRFGEYFDDNVGTCSRV